MLMFSRLDLEHKAICQSLLSIYASYPFQTKLEGNERIRYEGSYVRAGRVRKFQGNSFETRRLILSQQRFLKFLTWKTTAYSRPRHEFRRGHYYWLK